MGKVGFLRARAELAMFFRRRQNPPADKTPPPPHQTRCWSPSLPPRSLSPGNNLAVRDVVLVDDERGRQAGRGIERGRRVAGSEGEAQAVKYGHGGRGMDVPSEKRARSRPAPGVRSGTQREIPCSSRKRNDDIKEATKLLPHLNKNSFFLGARTRCVARGDIHSHMTPPSVSVAATSDAGEDGGGQGGGWGATAAPPSQPASPAFGSLRTAAALIARASATPRGGGLGTLLAAVGEDDTEHHFADRAAETPGGPRRRSSKKPWTTRFADAGGGSGRDALQIGVGMALAALPSILGPAWSPTFPGACTAPTFLLIAMLQMSPSSAVGVRLINVASLLGPAVVGSLAGGGAASLAAALDPRAGAAFAAVLAAAAVPILAAAAVVRGAPHAPAHVAGMGLVIALSAGSTMLGAASALAAARNAATAAAGGGGRRTPPPRGVLHAHWWLTVVPTLAAFGVAGAATVVASLLFPSLASTDVEAVTSRALAGCGEALSLAAGRLFAVAADPCLLQRAASTRVPLPPAGAGAAALPPVTLDGAADDGTALLMEREPVDAPEFEAWWARLCAPVDVPPGVGAVPPPMGPSLTDRLVESVLSRRRRRGKGGPPPVPPPAVGDGGGGRNQDCGPHHHLSLADPGPPVSSLRPLLAAARAALAAAASEPPLLRGWGARPFCTTAWERLLGATDALVTALSALQAVAGDDTALSDTRQLYPPRLEGALRDALAVAAACLARVAARVEGDEAEGGGQGEGAAPPPTTPPPPHADDRKDRGDDWWAARLDGLREAMADTVSGYVSRTRSARPGHRVVLPSAYTARSHAFAYVAAASVVARVADLDAAAAGALGCGCPPPPPPLKEVGHPHHRHHHALPAMPPTLAWLARLARIALCVPVWTATARAARGGVRRLRRVMERRRPGERAPHRRRRPGPRPWRATVASVKYFCTIWLALTATVFAIGASPPLARLGPSAGFTVACLTASDKVEATLTKTLLWTAATVCGGLVGGGLASIPGLPPLALASVLTVLAGALGAGAKTGFRTAATLTLITLSSIALCEASGTAGAAACAARGKAASPWCGLAGGPGVRAVPVWTAVAGRTCSVIAGLLLAQALCALVLPWFVTDWALASISTAVRDGAETFMEHQTLRFIAGGRDAWEAAARARGQQQVEAGADADDEEAPRLAWQPVYGLVQAMPDPLPPAGLDPRPLLDARGRLVAANGADADTALQVALASPLVDVQANLARDATAWSRGVLSTPRSVRVVLKSALSLLDALAALSFALDPAIVGGGSGQRAGGALSFALDPATVGGGSGQRAGGAPSLTGVLFEAYTVPTFPEILAVFRALRTLADRVAAHAVAVHPHARGAGWLDYCGPSAGEKEDGPSAGLTTPRRRRVACTRAALEESLAALVAARRTSIAAQAAARRAYHAAMVAAVDGEARGGDGGCPGTRADTFRAPVDVVRHLAFMGALIKASNRMQSVAVAVLQV